MRSYKYDVAPIAHTRYVPPGILLLPLLPQKRTGDPLAWFTTEGKCDLGDFPVCMKAFPSSVQGRLRHCINARNVVAHSQIQLILCYRYWYRTSLIVGVMLQP